MNSFVQKKKQRKWTCITPDNKTNKKIDYIILNNTHIVSDVTNLNSSNINSDRRFLRAKIQNKEIKKQFYNKIKLTLN